MGLAPAAAKRPAGLFTRGTGASQSSGDARRSVGTRDDERFPGRQRGAEAAFDLADLLDHLRLGDAGGAGLADAGEGRDVTPAIDEGAREERPDLLRRRAERDRAAEGADGLGGALVVEHGLPEAPEDVGRGGAVLRVLHGEAQDLFALVLLAELHARGAEEAEALRDEAARVGREHLPFGRAKEDRERRGPRAEERDDLGVLALLRED